MSGQTLARTALFAAVFALAGCSTVKLPDIDFLKMTGFFDKEDKIDGFPKVSDAPELPDNMRDDAVWEAEAKKLLQKRDEFNALDNGVAKSDVEIERDIEALKAKVQAYKADDPQ